LSENRTAAIQTIDRRPDDGKVLDRGVHRAFVAIPGECRRGPAAQRRLWFTCAGRRAACSSVAGFPAQTAMVTCGRRGPGEEFLLIPVRGLVFLPSALHAVRLLPPGPPTQAAIHRLHSRVKPVVA